MYNTPDDYLDTLEGLPDNCSILEKGEIDFIHWFCHSQVELIGNYPTIKARLNQDGLMWVSWPKMASHIDSDLTRDWIREYILDHGLVDVKVASYGHT